MKKTLFLIVAMLVSTSSYAATEHYILRDGNHVQHLKITKIGDELTVTADVDFEPNASETDKKACSADITGEAEAVSKDEIVMKKHIEGEAKICTLKLHLTQNGVKLDQSEECSYYAVGLCHFNSEGKELLKVK
jgi:hypothetical protein